MMNRARSVAVPALAALLSAAGAVQAQPRPYLGYAYPAGGRQGTTFLVKVGGQGMTGIQGAVVSGVGVRAELVQYHFKLSPQDSGILSQQIRKLRESLRKPDPKRRRTPPPPPRTMPDLMADAMGAPEPPGALGASAAAGDTEATRRLIEKIEVRLREYVNRPAVAAAADIAYLKVTIAPGAEPGERDLRVITLQGVSNPLMFCVGQEPETCREPMKTSALQVLGKEYLAQRTRPDDEVEVRIDLPCTMNGQIASGEVNRYRFWASKGQRLVISTLARQLIPYIADAVPGWFQPVVVLHDAEGNEVAYDDDYRFKPDPFLCVEVPRDGEYVLSIYDSIYRGREDFVYRISIGELPFITSIFPLGGRAGAVPQVRMRGWHLDGAKLVPPAADAAPGIHLLRARKGTLRTNRVPFQIDTLPEGFDQEPNDHRAGAQDVPLPIILNGRIDRPGDRDVFRFKGRAGETIVAEVHARRLDCPTDSVLSLIDERGELLILNDDRVTMFDEGREDKDVSLKAPGLTTHQADSYLRFQLPADGVYYVEMAETAGQGGPEDAYRLRISAPRPDFELRAVPSSIALRGRSSAGVTVFALRKDGFDGAIRLGLRNPPEGITSVPGWIGSNQTLGRLGLKTQLESSGLRPIDLVIEGRAMTEQGEIVRRAVPAEDRMQAFLWRHLVPAQEQAVQALVYDPKFKPPPARIPRYASKLEQP